MKIVLSVKDYAAMKNISYQAAYQQIKSKKVLSETVNVQHEEIGIVVDSIDLSSEETQRLKDLLHS